MDLHRSFSERAYALLIRAYPAHFREEYGEELQNFFRDQLRESRTQNKRFGVLRLWFRAVKDVATMSMTTHFNELRNCSNDATPNPTPVRKATMISAISQDFRYTIRGLRKNPVFTGVAVAVIALGTGAVSTIFSVGNSMILHSLPGVKNASEIVMMERVGDHGSLSASYAYYQNLVAQSRKMSGISAWSMLQLTVSSGSEAVTSLGNIVSGNYFEVLGVQPELGRFFAGDERRVPDAHPVVVISHEFWQRQFAGDSGIIGKQILVNGMKFDVIGVAPARFSGLYPVLRTDVWVSLMMQRAVRRGGDLLTNPNSAWLEMFGRIAPATSLKAAEIELSAITKQRIDGAGEPKFMNCCPNVRLAVASGFPSDATRPITSFFLVLLVVAGLVLLIASVNVASMLLARAVARRREIAVRIALGASRARLIRQLLTESVLLFSVGGVLGTAFAVLATRLLQRIQLPVDVPMVLNFSPDLRVLVVTLSVALITGVTFGLLPALRGSRAEIATTLRNDSDGAGRGRSRLRNSLVIGQMAMSLLLLTASGLFVRALDKGQRVDIGIDITHVSTTALNVGTAGFDSTRGRQFYLDLASRLNAIPGVGSVGYSRILPLSMSSSGIDISVPESSAQSTKFDRAFPVSNNIVDAGYLAVTKMPFVSGRSFNASDDDHSRRVAIINETFAKTYWTVQSAVGRSIMLDGATLTIVGVVRNTKYTKLSEENQRFMFLPYAQNWRSDVNLVVRSSIDERQMASIIRREVHALDSFLPVPTVTTLQQATAVNLLPQRVAVLVTGVLGIAGLLLAAIGLYGVISFSTAQRTREIGVRVALGAARYDVLRLVVGEGMNLVGIGMAVGLALALVATRALTSFLFGVSPLDGLTFVAVALILAACALLASYLPARRAAKIDPMLALRQD
ncbi:MAG: ABC transporter permease [Gemmatimonadaceae bacterium]